MFLHQDAGWTLRTDIAWSEAQSHGDWGLCSLQNSSFSTKTTIYISAVWRVFIRDVPKLTGDITTMIHISSVQVTKATLQKSSLYLGKSFKMSSQLCICVHMYPICIFKQLIHFETVLLDTNLISLAAVRYLYRSIRHMKESFPRLKFHLPNLSYLKIKYLI